MFEGFKPEFKYAAYLTSFYILKDMCVPAVLIFGVFNPFIQLAPMILLQVIIIAVLIYFRPYEKRAENFLAIYNSILYFFGILFFLMLAAIGDFLTEQQRYLFLGFPLIGILMLIIIANIGYGVFDSMYAVFTGVKKLCAKKKIPNKIEDTKKEAKDDKKKGKKGKRVKKNTLDSSTNNPLNLDQS